MIYPDSTAVTYSFNKGSQLTSLSDWASRSTSYSYGPDGKPSSATNAGSTTVTYSYDNALRLTQLLNQFGGGTTISQHSYTLDAMGNRTQVAEVLTQVGGGTLTPTITYGYDTLYRLTGDGTNSYSYDPVGNRLTWGATTYSYDRADRITAAGATSYTVNANGNLTARGSDSFVYDQANRLTSATVSGTTTVYAYDGDGKRASKTVAGSTTSFVYDVSGTLPMLLDDGSRKYVWGLGLAYTVDGSGNVEVSHEDGLGSVRALTDGSGTLTQTYQTDPFGVPTATQGGSGQPFGFTGEQRDAETGFVYLRARVYDPQIGRFLQRDALVVSGPGAQGLNRYAYSSNNPALLTDPSGQCPMCAGAVVGGGAIVGGVAAGSIYNNNHQDDWNGVEFALVTGAGAVAGAGVAYAGVVIVAEGVAAGAVAAAAPIVAKAGEVASRYIAAGVAASRPATEITFKSAHGARHVAPRGLSAEEVEGAIREAAHETIQGASSVGSFWGQVTVRGQIIEYRAYAISETTINVGTYYPLE